MEIDTELRERVRQETRRSFGMLLTDPFISQLLSGWPEIRNGYVSAGMDTVVRELVADCIAQELGLGRWPTYGDGEEAQTRFLVKLHGALEAAGQGMEP
jgi:hypothetical protein